MRFIESESLDPFYNLALEEYVFEKLPKTEEYLYLWRNRKTVVVGKYQNTAEEVNLSYAKANGISVVRRLSGGGAVFHDAGNLNFSLIVDQKDAEEAFDFRRFSAPLIRVLESYGIAAEFTGRNDVLIDGKKICGNAQYAKNGRLLHHGCILLDSDLSDVSAALKVRPAKFQSKSVQSVRSRVATINDYAAERIEMADFRNRLREEVLKGQNGGRYVLTAKEEAEVLKLQDEKYVRWEWNYGNDEAYEMQREERFPCGTISVSLKSQNGVIEAIRFSGDFFGNGEIRELEGALSGLRLDERLAEELRRLRASDYIHGVSEDALASLIRG